MTNIISIIIIIITIIIIIDIATVVTNIIRCPNLGFIAQLEHRPAGRQSSVFGIIRITIINLGKIIIMISIIVRGIFIIIVRGIIIIMIFIINMIIMIIRLIESPNMMLHACRPSLLESFSYNH